MQYKILFLHREVLISEAKIYEFEKLLTQAVEIDKLIKNKPLKGRKLKKSTLIWTLHKH